MKRFACSIVGCLLMLGVLYAPLYAQTVQRQNLPHGRRVPLPLPPPESESDNTKAYKDKIYQCKDDGKFSESSSPSIAVDEVLSAKDVSSRARIIYKPEPRFTERARRNMTNGTVRLRLLLTADGKVADVRIIKGLADGLAENSIRAACGIQFMPALKDDRPVSQSVMVEYGFYVGLGPFPHP